MHTGAYQGHFLTNRGQLRQGNMEGHNLIAECKAAFRTETQFVHPALHLKWQFSVRKTPSEPGLAVHLTHRELSVLMGVSLQRKM